ncbi:aldose 1-epimerase family protein [Zhihengliuella salsuginis]|uniref:Aldose 1-epimerase n=1 Tax=Zhihengliuella salsuginis TaxID=578222 RepID=A0ABQ3GIV3_9MICC|nr:aldose 1-epimerase family protein [Zhihengliuella salsuginis]GHD09550.1 aldose 1-epimerase [Zhihengliuella salsuginis]
MNATSSAAGASISGEQFSIRRGGGQAVIAALAGALREYRRDGVDLVESFDADATPPFAAGILLAPWPNRIAGAAWDLDGATQQLDVTEAATGNAIHGLLRNTGYRALEHGDHHVTIAAEIYPQHGYAYRLTHTARYELDADGQLAVTQRLAHHGSLDGGPAPAALGAHPFLRVGDVPTDELRLTTTATSFLPVDEKMIPVGTADAAGDMDFRSGRLLDGFRTDTAFGGLSLDDDGRYHHRLDAPDGRGVELWADATCPYVHIFVTDKFPGRDAAIAIEPMTAPANTFNTGEGLTWLAPGEELVAHWGITSWL